MHTIEEIDFVKSTLMSDKKGLKLGIKEWKVNQAYPPTDIIWSEIHNIV